ncbi:MAG: CRISPR-associated endonuclease Cas2 [Cyanobacteria bacterium P01_H01_bin.21]
MLVVVVYDIPNDKRRLKLSNLLEGYGRRVQYSVFECFLSLTQMRKLCIRVKQQIDMTEDNVRFYWISADAMTKTLTLGSDPPKPPPNAYIV